MANRGARWRRGGIVPDFALEVVGSDPKKDYEESPMRYADLGVPEVIVFDPFPGQDRRSFTVYRRQGDVLLQVDASDADRVWSQRLRCFVRCVGRDAAMRLRLGVGDNGDVLFPTGEEAERAAKEEAQSQLDAALREVAALKAELARRG